MAAVLARRLSAAAPAAARSITISAKAVRYAKHGHPSAVLQLETLTLDTSKMGAADVLVQMVAAPFTALDYAAVTGFAGAAPSFPRVGGNEGLGVVAEAGTSSGLAKGDVVVASKAGVGTWSTHVIDRGDSFTKVEGVDASSSASAAAALAAAAVSPLVSAKLLLDGFVALKAGDVVVQSGADALAGQAIVQLAAARGLRTVNVARGNPAGGWAKLSEHLQGLGATAVVSEEQAARHDFRKLLADLAPPKLGLNATGGKAAGTVLRALGEGATLVSFGASISGVSSGAGRASAAVQVPLALFTHKDLTLRGFSLARASTKMSKAMRDAEAHEAVAAVAGAAAKVKLLVAREPFADFRAALPRALASVAAPKGTVAERTVVFTF